jgi:hypothetical protein
MLPAQSNSRRLQFLSNLSDANDAWIKRSKMERVHVGQSLRASYMDVV